MNKLKIMLVMLLLIHLLSNSYSSLMVINATSDGTIVGGIIRSDTTWKKENSPYTLEDDITVRPGVTLRIQEGVVVDFSLWSMIINGELRVTGEHGEKIQFHFTVKPLTSYEDARIVFTEKSTPWKEGSIQGSRLEYVDIYCVENTVNHGLIHGGTLKLDHVTVYNSVPLSKYYTLKINGSVTNSHFVRVARAVHMGEGEIVDNTFVNSTSTVIYINNGLVRNNVIDGGRRGISVKNALLRNNTIKNISSRGINIVNDPISLASLNNMEIPRPIITNNLLMDCGEDAVFISGFIRPTIRLNVFYENKKGIYFNEHPIYNDTDPRINNNLFYNNDYNIYFDREDPRIEITLQNNWWGTNDTELIEDKIYYERDDPRITAALYQPFLTDPPFFEPKISYDLTIFQPSHEVELNNVVPVSGIVYPPLDRFEFQLRYSGPDDQVIERILSTDSEGIFMDEFNPSSIGLWNITIESEENNLLESYSVQTRVLNITESALVNTSGTETSLERGDVSPEDMMSHGTFNQTGQDETDISEVTEDEVTDIEYVYETGDEDSLPVYPTKDIVSERDPLIIGFIPSILVFVLLIALYIGVNGVKQ